MRLAMPTPCEATGNATNKWCVEIGSDSDSSPAVGTDGTIYFGTFDGKLWALRPDGSNKWVFQVNSEIRSSPALGTDGTVYIGSRNRKLYAVPGKWKEEMGIQDRRVGGLLTGAGQRRHYLLRFLGPEFLRVVTLTAPKSGDFKPAVRLYRRPQSMPEGGFTSGPMTGSSTRWIPMENRLGLSPPEPRLFLRRPSMRREACTLLP